MDIFQFYYENDYIPYPPEIENGRGGIMRDFLDGIVEVSTGVIGAITGGMQGIAEAAIENPIIIFAVGLGLTFVGIKFIPRLISALRG